MEFQEHARSGPNPAHTPDFRPETVPGPVPAQDDRKVIRRTGSVVGFDPQKIRVAISKAFLATEGDGALASSSRREIIDGAVDEVIRGLGRRRPVSSTLTIEEIQDQVELVLMRGGHHKVARNYVLYREERNRERRERVRSIGSREIRIVGPDGGRALLDLDHCHRRVEMACQGLGDVDSTLVLRTAVNELYDGARQEEVHQALIFAARSMIEKEPNYSLVSARLLLDRLRAEVFGHDLLHGHMGEAYPRHLRGMLDLGVDAGRIDPALRVRFDLGRLGAALAPERDLSFGYLGLQTLYDRYLLKVKGRRIEMPQTFFMRVAMGLALREDDPTARAAEFYDLLSRFDFMSSTPTLFNSGTLHPQLSSCYLSTVSDDLDGIFTAIKENAMLAKFAGGLGNDWTPVRAMGSHIRGTDGKSQGVVPFLKVVNDTAVAVNQCFSPGTLVCTPDGPRRISAVRKGDLVLGQGGTFREVLETFAYEQDGPMVGVSVAHSAEPLMVTSGHPLMAVAVAGRAPDARAARELVASGACEPAWRDAGTLSAGDYVAQVIPRESVNVPGLSATDACVLGMALACGESDDGVTLRFRLPGGKARGAARKLLDRADLGLVGDASGLLALAPMRTDALEGTTGRPVPGTGTAGEFVRAAGLRRIPRRLAHLPAGLARALVEGVLSSMGDTDGGGTRLPTLLAEDVRWQLARLGIPCSGRRVTPWATELDIDADGLRDRASGQAGDGWFRHGDMLFSRVGRVAPAAPSATVHDLKVEGDESYMTAAALAHNGGKRKGAVCCYLETWHLDIEEFLDLRKNSGDERRRTHDMNTANWVPDLFMKRVEHKGKWTLFSPDSVPDLHDKFGRDFEDAYVAYERLAEQGEIGPSRQVEAADLWRKMLTMLFETGHPWICFKDACNIRSPQQHCGVVHSSNLCTEITLNTGPREIAVCNLGSVNLARHVRDGRLDGEKIRATVTTAMRMLDNVVDINYYAVDKAERSNLSHRPVGLGIMGFQDALHELGISYASDEAVEFADRSMETVAYHAYSASADLAIERGAYDTFVGSLWDRGLLPVDTLDMLEEQRGDKVTVDRSSTLDWGALREKIQRQGMRNSNCLAIAPTATIANIVGVTSSIEPTYQNVFVKSNLSGDFTVSNVRMVREMRDLGIWDESMVADIKYYNGALGKIDRVPADMKARYPTAHEIDPMWLVRAAARRQKWIDQSQSLNLYFGAPEGQAPSGRQLSEVYRGAWRHGLKTTYYLRTLAASTTEQYTVRPGRHNAVPTGGGAAPAAGNGTGNGAGANGANGGARACAIDDPDGCEACQ